MVGQTARRPRYPSLRLQRHQRRRVPQQRLQAGRRRAGTLRLRVSESATPDTSHYNRAVTHLLRKTKAEKVILKRDELHGYEMRRCAIERNWQRCREWPPEGGLHTNSNSNNNLYIACKQNNFKTSEQSIKLFMTLKTKHKSK